MVPTDIHRYLQQHIFLLYFYTLFKPYFDTINILALSVQNCFPYTVALVIVDRVDGLETRWKFNRTQLSMLNLGSCKFVHLHRHVSTVFLVKQQITAFGCDYCSSYGWMIK